MLSEMVENDKWRIRKKSGKNYLQPNTEVQTYHLTYAKVFKFSYQLKNENNVCFYTNCNKFTGKLFIRR